MASCFLNGYILVYYKILHVTFVGKKNYVRDQDDWEQCLETIFSLNIRNDFTESVQQNNFQWQLTG